MDDTLPSRTVTRYRLTPALAEQRVRKFAEASETIAWSSHALRRMNEREIFDVDVLRTLRCGMISGEPEGTAMGEWKCKMVHRLRGTREAGVVIIILKRGGLFIKTVEWEDLS
jgi:hypothetical protein